MLGHANIIDDFVRRTEGRMPTTDEIVGLAQSCGVSFRINDEGQPCLRATPENRDIALLVHDIVSREPWRSQVIQRFQEQR